MMRTAIALAFVACVTLASTATAQSYVAAIDGAQEAPPSGSTATGIGSFTLDGAKMLNFNISFSGLLGTETAAHIHGPAGPGVNAGVVFGLPAGSPKVGAVGPLSPAQEADLNAGLYYVNIHSTMFPGGEIRGQILSSVPTENSSWGAIKSIYGSN
jgi:hypothetical protein